MQQDEKDLKKQLLGDCQGITKTGGCKVDLEKISVFDGDGGYIRCFCAGCGTYLDLIEKGARILNKRYGLGIEDDVKGKYVEVTGCIGCGDDFEEASLKEIK